MIHEYALDPELLANWQSFRYFVENFGISKGRLIARFPGKWERAVHESIQRSDCGDIEKARLQEKLRRVDKKIFRLRDCSGWTNALNWFQNCLAEHQKCSFSAIIVSNPKAPNEIVLDGHALDSEMKPWKAATSKTVRRDGVEMSQRLRLFLQESTRLVFVDQYFDPDKLRFRHPLERFLEIAVKSPFRPLREVQYHISDELFTEQYFKTKALVKLPAIIPEGLSVKFIQWTQKQLHNRYILSDIGAVMFGHGLDERDGDGPETDTIALLSESHHLEILAFYGKRQAFCEILGKKK